MLVEGKVQQGKKIWCAGKQEEGYLGGQEGTFWLLHTASLGAERAVPYQQSRCIHRDEASLFIRCAQYSDAKVTVGVVETNKCLGLYSLFASLSHRLREHFQTTQACCFGAILPFS